jgi:hypothetical protein
MALKAEIKTVISVNYGDLETFIKEETGHGYNIPSEEEVNNDTCLEFAGIDGNKQGHIVEFEEDWAKFKTTGKCRYALRIILEGLCLEGKIQAGDYLVKVSW